MATSLRREDFSFQPLTSGKWDDFERLFSEPGVQNGCWCTYWRVTRADYSRNYGEGNRRWMKSQVDAGNIPGILAYRDKEPVAWCSVAPREDFAALERSPTLKKVDDRPVWSILCFFISRPYRRKGLMRILIEAAIQYARENGAQIVEAYPIIPENVPDARYERYTGVISAFETAGFQEVARRSMRRPVMRYHIQ